MKRPLIALALMLLLLAGCSRSEKEETVSTYPGGQKRETGVFRGNKPNRAQVKGFEYYESGERKKEFNYKDNHFFGPWTFWYKNGTKLAQGNIEMKTMDHQNAIGSGTYYWPSGARMIELKPTTDRSASEVSAIYDESGKAYTPSNKPQAVAEKIKALLERWYKGEI